jgi:hypothetical protein
MPRLRGSAPRDSVSPVVTSISTLLLISVIVAAAMVGRAGLSEFNVPWLTGITAILLGFCLFAQLNRPELILTMERNSSAIHTGQAYRLFTALWFQDGGLEGATFNIAMLAILGGLAEQVLSKIAWLGIYLIGGFMSEVVALGWQTIGAGNSVAYMSLAGALLAFSIHRHASSRTWVVAGLGMASGLFLCLRKDIHGAAVLIGFGLLLVARTEVEADTGKT